MEDGLRQFYGLLVRSVDPSTHVRGFRDIAREPRLLPDAPGRFFPTLRDCVDAFQDAEELAPEGDEEITLRLRAAHELCDRIAHAVDHWDEFTAAHGAYPLRKTREYAKSVRLLAEWRAFTVVYEHPTEHLRAGRVDEALLPYAIHNPHAFWEWFWEYALENTVRVTDWLCEHMVPQLLPQQEPYCRYALQAILNLTYHNTADLAVDAMHTALLATHITVYPKRASLGAATLHDMRAGDFTPARDGPWRVFLP